MLFQRNWISCPTCSWWLTTICHHSYILGVLMHFFFFVYVGITCMWYTGIHGGKELKHIKLKHIFFKLEKKRHFKYKTSKHMETNIATHITSYSQQCFSGAYTFSKMRVFKHLLFPYITFPPLFVR